MISQTIAVAAAAALFAPAVYADADAPTAATPATPAGDPEVSPATEMILGDFDVTGEESYTLLMPFNMDKMGNLLSEEYDLNSTEVTAAADDIIQAHILPGTLNFQTLQEETNATGMYTVASLQGFEWTFGWNMGDEGGFPFIVDEWNVTTDGMIEIQPDIRAEPDCPNVIIGINGFVVTPDLLTEAPAPAPTPPATPPPPPETPAAPVDPAPETAAPAPENDSSAASGLTTTSLAALSAVGAAALSAALL